MKKIAVKIIGLQPEYKSEQAAGCDLINAGSAKRLLPNDSAIFQTGIKIQLPDGYEAQVRSRSGHNFKNGLVVPTGTIDADYRGEICVKVYNLSREEYTVQPGERIAQLVIAPVVQARWKAVESLDASMRGEKGFGSTGKN